MLNFSIGFLFAFLNISVFVGLFIWLIYFTVETLRLLRKINTRLEAIDSKTKD